MFSIRRGAATEAASAIHFTLRCSIVEAPTSLAQRASTYRAPLRNEVKRVQKQRHLSAVVTDRAVVAHWIPDKHPGFKFAISVKTRQPITRRSVRVYCLIFSCLRSTLLDIDCLNEVLPTPGWKKKQNKNYGWIVAFLPKEINLYSGFLRQCEQLFVCLNFRLNHIV